MEKFIIYNEEYFGDFDLDLTINSGQTSQIPWKYIDGKYYEVLVIDEAMVLVKLSQKTTNSPLYVEYYSDVDINEEIVRRKIFYLFDLDYDITGLYSFLNDNNELNNVYKFNQGLRLYKAQFPFECIISSICSANNSIKRWTKSMQTIRENCGKSISYNGENYYLFPTEDIFLNIPEDELKSYGVGYRSSYMINSTKSILSSENFHEKISKLSYDDAFEYILDLEGVGPKVADCILLYGYNKHEAYPVDVWINRITTHLYFNGQKPSNKKIMNFARDNFGIYSGYVQLYLFNYARLSGLMDKLKVSKNN